jgi:hypothetical protein
VVYDNDGQDTNDALIRSSRRPEDTVEDTLIEHGQRC